MNLKRCLTLSCESSGFVAACSESLLRELVHNATSPANIFTCSRRSSIWSVIVDPVCGRIVIVNMLTWSIHATIRNTCWCHFLQINNNQLHAHTHTTTPKFSLLYMHVFTWNRFYQRKANTTHPRQTVTCTKQITCLGSFRKWVNNGIIISLSTDRISSSILHITKFDSILRRYWTSCWWPTCRALTIAAWW